MLNSCVYILRRHHWKIAGSGEKKKKKKKKIEKNIKKEELLTTINVTPFVLSIRSGHGRCEWWFVQGNDRSNLIILMRYHIVDLSSFRDRHFFCLFFLKKKERKENKKWSTTRHYPCNIVIKKRKSVGGERERERKYRVSR